MRLDPEDIAAIASAVVTALDERREQKRVEEARERAACDLCEDGVERTGSLHRMQHEHNGSTYYIGCPDTEGE